MAKEILYRGKKIEELEKMGYNELAELLPCRVRRNLKRGFTEKQKILLAKIKEAKEGKRKRAIKTHCRDLCVLPEMVGVTIHVHTGKQYFQLLITEEMLGHYIGEFARTRQEVTHKAPGVGATKGTKHASVK